MAGVDPYDPERAHDDLVRAMASGDPSRIASTANAYAWALTTCHYDLLVRALDSLPAEYFARYELLAAVHPLASTLARGELHAQTTDASEPIILDQGDLVEELVKRLVVRRLNGDVKGSLVAAERLDERLSGHTWGIARRDWCPVAQFRFQMGFTYLLDGQTRRALRSFLTAAQLSTLAPGDHVKRDAALRSAVIHALRGSHDRALEQLRVARSAPEAPRAFRSFNRTAEHIASALVHLDGLHPALETHVAELDSCSPIDELWPLIALIRARLELLRGRPLAALEEISLAFSTHTWAPDTLADDIRVSSVVQAFLELGQIGAAHTVSEEAAHRLPLARLARIRLKIHDGQLADAATDCRDLISGPDAAPSVRAEAMILLAWAGMEMDGQVDANLARTIVRSALSGGQVRVLTTVPEDVLDALLSNGSETEARRLRQLLHGHGHAAPRPRHPRLTPSELRVLEELATSAKTAEIARKLFVTPNTVKTQLASIYRKLGVRSREDAVSTAARLGIISEREEARETPAAGSATPIWDMPGDARMKAGLPRYEVRHAPTTGGRPAGLLS